MNKTKLGMTLLAIACVNVLFFQNCTKTASFSVTPVSEAITTTSDGETDGDGEIVVEVPVKRECTKTDEYLNPATNECELFKCAVYEEISGNEIKVPKRDVTTGKCYYTKLMNAGNSANSIETNVISRNHGREDGNPETNLPPIVLGSKQMNVTLLGDRAVKLSGSPSDITQPIYVDNYIFVRMNKDSFTHAYGTGDSTIQDQSGVTDHILYNNKKVPFTAYEAYGTATIADLNVTGNLPVGVKTDVTVQALDCGAGRDINTIYIMFQ